MEYIMLVDSIALDIRSGCQNEYCRTGGDGTGTIGGADRWHPREQKEEIP